MTANDINKIDDSLKMRPSRLKFVREFSNPDREIRTRILGNETLADQTENMSLDQVFALKDKSNG